MLKSSNTWHDLTAFQQWTLLYFFKYGNTIRSPEKLIMNACTTTVMSIKNMDDIYSDLQSLVDRNLLKKTITESGSALFSITDKGVFLVTHQMNELKIILDDKFSKKTQSLFNDEYFRDLKTKLSRNKIMTTVDLAMFVLSNFMPFVKVLNQMDLLSSDQ